MVYEAEVELEESLLDRYDKFIKHINWEEIRNLALNKRLKEIENLK